VSFSTLGVVLRPSPSEKYYLFDEPTEKLRMYLHPMTASKFSAVKNSSELMSPELE
jgi:hypothetical protein